MQLLNKLITIQTLEGKSIFFGLLYILYLYFLYHIIIMMMIMIASTTMIMI